MAGRIVDYVDPDTRRLVIIAGLRQSEGNSQEKKLDVGRTSDLLDHSTF